MAFIACGLNHKTAPIAVRETLALTLEQQKTLLDAILDMPQINEAAILSTCNRTELYCEIQNPDLLLPWIANYFHLPLEQIQTFFYLLTDQAAIKQLLRVASGLDSMMLGESQILGQMKQAFQHAEACGAVGTALRQIFPFVFGASKRIRNQSGISQHATSVAFARLSLSTANVLRKKYCPTERLLFGINAVRVGQTAVCVMWPRVFLPKRHLAKP